MPNTSKESVVGVFRSVDDAQQALAKFQEHGWNMAQLSLIARGHESELELTPKRQTGQMEKSAAIGGAAGATLGLLASSALFIVPGLGPVLFAGAVASGITGGLVGGLVGAMSGWGIEGNHVREYEEQLKNGKALLIIAGEPDVLAEGRALLLATKAERVLMHADTADSTVDA